MLTQRQLQVGEQVKRLLAFHLGDLEFYGIPPLSVNIMEVRMSADLKIATVYILPTEGADTKGVKAALKEHAPVLQREVAKESRLKFTPKLRFMLDETFEQAWKISQLLKS